MNVWCEQQAVSRVLAVQRFLRSRVQMRADQRRFRQTKRGSSFKILMSAQIFVSLAAAVLQSAVRVVEASKQRAVAVDAIKTIQVYLLMARKGDEMW